MQSVCTQLNGVDYFSANIIYRYRFSKFQVKVSCGEKNLSPYYLLSLYKF